MVVATAVPASAPSNSKTAAMTIPWLAVRTLVATTVAMELAASWKPLINSNTKAIKTTTKTNRTAAVMPFGSGMFQDDVENNVARVTAAVEHFFDQFVKVFQDDDVQGAVVAVVEFAQDFDHEFVGLPFDVLEVVVLGLDLLDVHALAEFFDEQHNGVGGLFQHGEM